MRFRHKHIPCSPARSKPGTRLFRVQAVGLRVESEISIEDLAHIDPEYQSSAAKLAENRPGVRFRNASASAPDKDLRGTPEQQRAGVKFMKRVIDQMVRSIPPRWWVWSIRLWAARTPCRRGNIDNNGKRS
jgi:hypothetical protein